MSNVKKAVLIVINRIEQWGIPCALQGILLTGLILGTLYTFIVPPWWHYDEAGHFEQAWLIANKYHLPSADEYDAEARRKIAESMIEYKWYSIRHTKLPDLNNNPVYIGALQNSGPRLYYIYSALPLQFVKNADMGTQNRAARLGSVVLFLGFLLVCWKLMEEIVPAGHPLQWMVPTFTALLPGLLDTMTSVNDDVGAVFVFSLFILYGVRIIKKGFSISNITGLILSLILCYLTKNTTWFAFILTPLIVLQGSFRFRKGWVVWVITIGSVAAICIAAFSWGDALYWYRISAQENDTRVIRNDAPHGNAVFQIDPSATTQVGQFVNSDAFYYLRGKTLTLGAWMWADKVVNAIFPFMAVTTFGNDTNSQLQVLSNKFIQVTADPFTHVAIFDIPETALIQVTTKPEFHKITFDVPNNAVRGWVYLYLHPNGASDQNSRINYDGIVLTEGNFSDYPPEFNNSTATFGVWDNKSFSNLLRNGSAELAGPRVYGWVDKYSGYIPNISGRISLILDSIIDQKGTSWYFRSAFSSMFQTFWSKFASGKVFLLSFFAYQVLQYLCLLAIFGIFIRIIFGWKNFPWDITLPFSLSMIFMWLSTFLRGAPDLANFTTVIPWARYALPSIIPTSIFICAGWFYAAKVLRKIGLTEFYFDYGFVALMISLNIFTILSIDAYFSDQSRTTFDVLFIITLFASFCAIWLVSKKATTTKIQV